MVILFYFNEWLGMEYFAVLSLVQTVKLHIGGRYLRMQVAYSMEVRICPCNDLSYCGTYIEVVAHVARLPGRGRVGVFLLGV